MWSWLTSHDQLTTVVAAVIAVVLVLRFLGYDSARDLKRRDDERAGAVRRGHERTDRILELLCLVALTVQPRDADPEVRAMLTRYLSELKTTPKEPSP